MAFQPAVNCAQVIVNYTLAGQHLENTFYGEYAGAYDITAIEALAAAMDSWANLALKPLLPSNLTYDGVTVRGLSSEFDLEAENNDHAGAGGAGATTKPNNVSLSVKRRSAFTGRGARGRVYLPPLPDGDYATDNEVSAVYVTAIETALNGIKAVMADIDWTEVILHRVASGVPLVEATIFTLIEYVVVNTVVDSQRRRLPGRGS